VVASAVGAWLTVTSLGSTGGPIAWSNPIPIVASSLIAESASSYSLSQISCHTTSLCVAVSQGGRALVTSSPTADVGPWDAADIDGTHLLTSVSCPSASLCVAVDAEGDAVVSTDPTGGASAWQTADIDRARVLMSVSCPSASLCVAVDAEGDAVVSTDPTGGASAWQVTAVDRANAPLYDVSCASESLCVAVDGFGDVVTSINPTGGSEEWNVANVDGIHSFPGGVSCPSISLCVAADNAGNAVTSTNPAGGAQAWTVTPVAGAGALGIVSCPTAKLCVATQTDGRVIASTDPTGEASTWVSSSIDAPSSVIDGLSCAVGPMCVAFDSADNAILGTGAAATQVLAISLAGVGRGSVSGQGVSCPSLCSANYPTGTSVTLTAKPASGSTFTGFSGDCTGSAPCQMTLDTPKSVTATFAANVNQPSFRLSVSLGGLGGGTVRGAGISCPPHCSESYTPATAVSLLATPEKGSVLAGWGGACKGTKECQVTMRANESVKATFAEAGARSLVNITHLAVDRRRHLVIVRFETRLPVPGTQCALVRRGVARGRPSRRPEPHFADCRSPVVYTHLRPGAYTVYVRASDMEASDLAMRRFELR
jgi:hypothetical protein